MMAVEPSSPQEQFSTIEDVMRALDPKGFELAIVLLEIDEEVGISTGWTNPQDRGLEKETQAIKVESGCEEIA